MDSADELGSLSDSEESGSDLTHENEPYSPPALEGEAPEDKILVTKPPVKNSADLEKPEEFDELTDENEKPTEKSLEEIAHNKAILEQELRISDKGLEKTNMDLMSTDKITDKEAVLKKELRILDKGWEKRKKDLYQGQSASKEGAKVQPKPSSAEVFDGGQAQEPAAKRLKESE